MAEIVGIFRSSERAMFDSMGSFAGADIGEGMFFGIVSLPVHFDASFA